MSHPKRLGEAELMQFSSRIPKALHRAVKAEAVTVEVPLQAWIREALEAHLKRVHAELRDAARASG